MWGLAGSVLVCDKPQKQNWGFLNPALVQRICKVSDFIEPENGDSYREVKMVLTTEK